MPINDSATLYAWNRAFCIPSHIIPGIALRCTKLSIWLYAYFLDVCVNANCWNDKPLRPEIRFWRLQVAYMFRFDHQRCFAYGGRCMGDRCCLLATTAAGRGHSGERRYLGRDELERWIAIQLTDGKDAGDGVCLQISRDRRYAGAGLARCDIKGVRARREYQVVAGLRITQAVDAGIASIRDRDSAYPWRKVIDTQLGLTASDMVVVNEDMQTKIIGSGSKRGNRIGDAGLYRQGLRDNGSIRPLANERNLHFVRTGGNGDIIGDCCEGEVAQHFCSIYKNVCRTNMGGCMDNTHKGRTIC